MYNKKENLYQKILSKQIYVINLKFGKLSKVQKQ